MSEHQMQSIEEDLQAGRTVYVANPKKGEYSVINYKALVVYLASPLGFNPEYQSYLDKIRTHLVALGHQVFWPWDKAERRVVYC